MSNGDEEPDETTEQAEETGAELPSEEPPTDPEDFEELLDAVEAKLDAAETEADLDEVDADLDAAETDLEAADLPEPDDEDEESPTEALESRIDDLRSELEERRGPYSEDVIEAIDGAESDIEGTEWTDTGRGELRETVAAFVDEVESLLDVDLGVDVTDDAETQTNALADAATAVGAEELHPDDDADTIAALLEAAEELQTGVDEAEEWTDLSIRERLDAHGYYDVLDHVKDYPPEWHALKVYEKRADVDMILLALDLLDSNFMEEHCIAALKKLGDEKSLDVMLQRAQKRDKPAIEVLGKIGSEEALDTILDYVDTPSDPKLQQTTLKALGEIGSEEATQEIANQLVAENKQVRSYAARALGLLGDTRAVDPLATVLAEDDEDTVRASAAWALNQIGTQRAIDAVAEYADDRAFLVQSEAQKAV